MAHKDAQTTVCITETLSSTQSWRALTAFQQAVKRNQPKDGKPPKVICKESGYSFYL